MRNNKHTELGESGRYPFTVPDGYFDTLADRIMQRIPDVDATAEANHDLPITSIKRTRLKGMRWVAALAVAASVVLAVVVTMKTVNASSADPVNELTAFAFDDDNASDEEILYSMVDNSDIYNYLAGYDY